MKLKISKREANVIQVALDHLYEEHKDVLSDAVRLNDARQRRESAHILRMIEDIQFEIKQSLV